MRVDVGLSLRRCNVEYGGALRATGGTERGELDWSNERLSVIYIHIYRSPISDLPRPIEPHPFWRRVLLCVVLQK